MSEMARVACGFCGQVAEEMHKDHIIPRSRGGGDDARNCLVSCAACNLSKSDRTPSEWRPSGLPSWIYEVEKELADRYKMKPRDRRRSAASSVRAVPGFALLKARFAVCLEWDRQQCRRPAEWETWDPLSGTWGAKCEWCAEFYRADHRREMDERRSLLHVLLQLRDGTLNADHETVLSLRARAGAVSLKEYLELATQMLLGESSVRADLKSAFPALGLELWAPADPAEAP